MNLIKQLANYPTQDIRLRKKRRRCLQRCVQHQFSLINFTNFQFVNRNMNIEICMCPKYQRGDLPPQSTHPQFNSDKLYFTSAFVLGIDKKDLQINQKQELIQHNRIIRVLCQKNCRVLFPKPNPKHKLCSVCKIQYQNYYSHIVSELHKQKIQNNAYNREIYQLTLRYSKLHPKNLSQISSPFMNHKKNNILQNSQTPQIINYNFENSKKQFDTKSSKTTHYHHFIAKSKMKAPIPKKQQNRKSLSSSSTSSISSNSSSDSSSSSSSLSPNSLKRKCSKNKSVSNSKSSSSSSSQDSTPIGQFIKNCLKKVPQPNYQAANKLQKQQKYQKPENTEKRGNKNYRQKNRKTFKLPKMIKQKSVHETKLETKHEQNNTKRQNHIQQLKINQNNESANVNQNFIPNRKIFLKKSLLNIQKKRNEVINQPQIIPNEVRDQTVFTKQYKGDFVQKQSKSQIDLFKLDIQEIQLNNDKQSNIQKINQIVQKDDQNKDSNSCVSKIIQQIQKRLELKKKPNLLADQNQLKNTIGQIKQLKIIANAAKVSDQTKNGSKLQVQPKYIEIVDEVEKKVRRPSWLSEWQDISTFSDFKKNPKIFKSNYYKQEKPKSMRQKIEDKKSLKKAQKQQLKSINFQQSDNLTNDVNIFLKKFFT